MTKKETLKWIVQIIASIASAAWVCKLKIPALTYRGQGFMKVFSRCILQLELISDGKLYQTAVILVVAGTILVDC